jgi:hypothetical protein
LATSKAILLLDDCTFKVLSCPVLAFDRDNEEIFIGHEGNSTLYPTPISIFARVATADVKVLVNDRPDDVDDSVSALHDFLVDHPVTATPMIANENAGANKNAEGDEDQQMAAFPFLHQITDPATTFANHYVAGLPAVIPLPPGHVLNSVDLRYEDAFVARLSEIGPHFYKWAAAMYKADNWWEGCSLNVKALAILPVFSHGLSETNLFRSTIFTRSSIVPPTSTDGRELLRRINHIKSTTSIIGSMQCTTAWCTSTRWRWTLHGSELFSSRTKYLPIPSFFYQSAHANAINNWRKAASGDNLGPYTSPPSTWTSPKATKEAAKKVSKVTETATPGAKSPHSTTTASTSGHQSAACTTGSNPNYGMVSAPDTIRHSPQLSCLAFAVKGKSCPKGITCSGSHTSFQNVSIPDLQLIDRWVTDTANVSWIGGRPRRLNDPATMTPAPATPLAQNTPAQVTPLGGADNQGWYNRTSKPYLVRSFASPFSA